MRALPVSICKSLNKYIVNFNNSEHHTNTPILFCLLFYTMGDLTGVLVGNDLQVAKTLKPSFAVKHVGPAVLSMANSGPNTNGSHLYSKGKIAFAVFIPLAVAYQTSSSLKKAINLGGTFHSYCASNVKCFTLSSRELER
ncbi:hypothetical protein D5086_026137 [Populus alba]|uniref:Uncharacterized protein n=1 Tax=Populus alba TaxID=43335 RepID=A0ACC4B127_POPAL